MALLMLLAPTATAADACDAKEKACVQAGEEDFEGVGAEAATGRISQTETAAGAAPQSRPAVRVVSRFAPTCSENTAMDGDSLCTAALTSCPEDGDIAYWVWEQAVPAGQQPDPGGWVRATSPAYVCKGPTDPAVSITQAVAGIVQREFSSYDLTRGRVVVAPEGRTLVGFETRFWTDATEYTFTRSILGRQVEIRATPEEYVFHFGDGTTERRSTAPRAGSDDVVHAYARAAQRQAHVVITWSGTYRVEGGPELAVRGTATTTGTPTVVDVREARSEYRGG
jgi:hypothetical protein